jgi:hypothetical protein
MAIGPKTHGGGFEMPRDLYGQRRRRPMPHRTHPVNGTSCPWSREGPREGPTQRVIALQSICSVSGTLGPYFKGKEGQKGRRAMQRVTDRKSGRDVPQWSQSPRPKTVTAEPLRCRSFQPGDHGGTLLGPCLHLTAMVPANHCETTSSRASLLSPLAEWCTPAMCRWVRPHPGGWRLAAAGAHLPPQRCRTGFIGAATEAGRSCPAYLLPWQKNS